MGRSGRVQIPGSRSLAVRMVLVSVLNPLIALSLFAAVVVIMPSSYRAGLFLALTFGIGARWWRKHKHESTERMLSERDDPDLFAVLNRLCALADLPAPALILSDQAQLNSWVVHVPGQPPRVYLTRGLREALTLEELQAVLGHELSHIANRDALVMTVVGGPARIMSASTNGGNLDAVLVGIIGFICQLGTTVLSRYREFTADAGAAAITGRPSALASALVKVSGSFEGIPQKDLRAAAALNAFNLVAVPPRGRRFRIGFLERAMATHPPLHARLAALEALERAQQLRSV